MSLPAVLTGAMGLALLEVVVTSPQAAGRVGALGTFGAAVVKRVIDPQVALIPNWHDTANQTITGPSPYGAQPGATPSYHPSGEGGPGWGVGNVGPTPGSTLLPQLPKARSRKARRGRKPMVAPAVN